MPSSLSKPARLVDFSGRLLIAALCLGLVLPATGWASGGSSSFPSTPSAPESPETNAQKHYEQGLAHRDKAWELEKKAAEAEGAAADKLLNKATKEYGKAVKLQRNAVTANPRMHQAYSSLGYALRKTGEFDESIEAYDRALTLAPGYTEAIEYRAEAYLALNRLEKAKSAYLTLMRVDQARADELMTAMKRWLAQNAQSESGSAGVSEADLEEFSSWVEERADVAGHAAMLGPAQARDW
ncbi:MAG: tetratricopeptide repeat protein [bacterium]|nr:tetratricopeptide repeat protein [bacterium]